MDMIALTYFNHLPHFIHTLELIKSQPIYVGVPKDNSFLTMIACVQEYGCHIQAHNASGYLWIPTPAAEGRKPGEIPNLYVRHRQGSTGATAGYDNQYSDNGFCVCFILKHSVDIPSRPFLRITNQNNIRDWSDLATKTAYKAAMGLITVDEYFHIVGDRIENDIKETIDRLMNPKNAPLTVENKGKQDPLIDTGKLRDSITHIPK